MKIILIIVCLLISNILGQISLTDPSSEERYFYYNDESQAEGMIDVYFIEISQDTNIDFYLFGTTYELYYPDGEKELDRSEYFMSEIEKDSLCFSKQNIHVQKIDTAGFEFQTDTLELLYHNKDTNKIERLSLNYQLKVQGYFTNDNTMHVLIRENGAEERNRKLYIFNRIEI